MIITWKERATASGSAWIWRMAEENKAREVKAEHKLDDIKYNEQRGWSCD